jgi:exosortase
MNDDPHPGVERQPPSGSLAEMVSEVSTPTFRQSFPWSTRAKVLVLVALFAWLNLWQFEILLTVWLDDSNWSHGFLIPLFSLYFLYSRREELFALPRRVCLLGLPVLLLGVLQILLGVYPIRNYWVSQLGMIPLLLGLVLYLAGWRLTRLTWLPICFLAFAMPIPGRLYGMIALPLQNLAASTSQAVLSLCGVDITVRSSALTLVSIGGVTRQLTVAEACSGMRMLVAFMALGVAMAYLDDRPIWQRLILVILAVPIAVLCNVIRVVITSTMFYRDRPELGQDFMHSFTGMLMLPPALLMLWLLGKLLRSLYVETDEEADGLDAGSPSPQGAKA